MSFTGAQGTSISSRPSWQDQLNAYCSSTKRTPPVFNIVSDRRGGRTAWSSTVTVQGLPGTVAARYWYDGQYVNNAKEDAAEVALKQLSSQPRASTVYPGQLYTQQSTGFGRGAGGF
ncbi:hypothetical protein PENANT_c020G06112 [Penicillium antarcticum]|uniref:DRBM domain-containing protein n=1 Tax=Penicillium antarcticum TaxID=416450 RepID=A0A1V6Q087_9EURO|nr:uncharacterized protein N7508_004475 [Penicillium antarcticum]KAJ5309096.1 hypothetical protein N7508_004475 [Penicillium antarcticum]OQD82625.1 hypothetical protein PENANT_c020G06112 [Penicillium antarcticum]